MPKNVMANYFRGNKLPKNVMANYIRGNKLPKNVMANYFRGNKLPKNVMANYIRGNFHPQLKKPCGLMCPPKLGQISITPLRLLKHDSDIQSGSCFFVLS